MCITYSLLSCKLTGRVNYRKDYVNFQELSSLKLFIKVSSNLETSLTQLKLSIVKTNYPLKIL